MRVMTKKNRTEIMQDLVLRLRGAGVPTYLSRSVARAWIIDNNRRLAIAILKAGKFEVLEEQDDEGRTVHVIRKELEMRREIENIRDGISVD